MLVWLCLPRHHRSAAISQQKELLEKPQSRRVFREMEDDTSSLFVHRNVESILTSSSSSTRSSTSTFGGASRLLLKFDFDKQLFMSKIYERWIRGPSGKAHFEQRPELNQSSMETPYVETRGGLRPELVETQEKFITDDNVLDRVETREKFSLLPPVVTGDKFTADNNVLNSVETRDKFSILPPVITGDKFTTDGIIDTPVEMREKFVTDEMAESPYSSITDDSTLVSSFGSMLSPTWTNNSTIKDKWKPLKLISPTREKSESQKRSLAIDSALKEEHRRKQRHAYRALLLGSESRLHILTAAKMRDKKMAYTRQELENYRAAILKHVVDLVHVLMKEIRRVQVNPQARYLWAYVELIEGYYYDYAENPRALIEPDEKFFSALESVLQDPHVTDLVRWSSSPGQDGIWPRSAQHFFCSVSRISSSDYVPIELDILYLTNFSSVARGADKAEVHEGDLTLDFLDIGSLTGKRGKWIHHFEGAQFVIFVVDLDQCYDAQKMAETMRLLDTVVCSRWFAGASIILLLNVNITDNGGGHRKARKAAQYVLGKFEDLHIDRLFISPCNMTNGEPAIKLIFSAVKEAILTEALSEGKMLL
ncbi:guanine nucleotide-binding protein alpha-3 subunit [Phlyctema vagabunda]|uniref:Guanine nucleotide-binding protein alpha-3 subunit n=1 Tax=Phlyctema vagabunda TaxID=108571 RepID=A0ABR4PF25_9HELO